MARVSAVLDSASVTTNAAASATITVKAHLENGSSSYGWGAGLKVYIDGELVKTVTGYSSTAGGSFASVTATKKITKTTASQSITCKITAYSTTVDGMGGCGDSNISPKTVSKSVSVAALASYSITYNANGGSGAPSAQTKYYGKTLTLSSTKPVKAGFTFQGWDSSSAGSSVAYKAGGSYTANSAATLYAVWAADTVTVSFDANGGTGAPATMTGASGAAMALPSTEPVRANYAFQGWSTSSTSSSAEYAAGASFTPSANTTLYAVWAYSVTAPTLNAVYDIGRTASTSSTALVEDGSYLYAIINYAYPDPSVSGSTKRLYYTIKKADGTAVSSSYLNYSVSDPNANLQFRYFTAVSPEVTYVAEVYLYDVDYQTRSNTLSIRFPKQLITFQVAKGGTGVGIGCAAPDEGFKVGFSSMFTEPVTCNSSVTASSVTASGQVRGATVAAATDASAQRFTVPNETSSSTAGFCGTTSAGTVAQMLYASSSDNVVLGYSGTFGATNIYGGGDKRVSLGTSSNNTDVYHNGRQVMHLLNSNVTSAKSISASTWTNTGCSISCHAGIWIIVGKVQFASNNTGRRGVRMTNGGTTCDRSSVYLPAVAGSAGNLQAQSVMLIELGSTSTIALQCYQSSGSALNMSEAFLYAACVG
ncbi:MAG: InlB B-repeat-containing protein [Coriobacteriales bacterium]